MKPKVHQRTTQGQAVAEGAATSVVMTLMMVASIALMIATGQCMLYQLKAQLAAQEGAQAALAEPAGTTTSWMGADAGQGAAVLLSVTSRQQSQVDAAVASCLTTLQMPPSSAGKSTTGSITTPGGNLIAVVQPEGDGVSSGFNAYTVTVTCKNLKLMSGGILPVSIPAVTGTACATSGNTSPPALLWRYSWGTMSGSMPDPSHSGGVTIPAYNGSQGFSTTMPGPVAASNVPSSQQFELLTETPFNPGYNSSSSPPFAPPVTGMPGYPDFQAFQIGF